MERTTRARKQNNQRANYNTAELKAGIDPVAVAGWLINLGGLRDV